MNRLCGLAAAAALVGAASWAPAQGVLDRLEREVQEALGDEGTGLEEAGPEREQGFLGLVPDDQEENGTGVRVVEIRPGGPADVAGLMQDDLITGIDGRPVRSLADLERLLTGQPPGTVLEFEVVRDGPDGVESGVVEVTLGRRPGRDPGFDDSQPQAEDLPEPDSSRKTGLLGITMAEVNIGVQRAYGLPVGRGVLVTEVKPRTAAARARIPEGAVIVAFDEKRVDRPEELADLVTAAGRGAVVKLAFYYDGRLFERRLTLGEEQPAAEGPQPPADEPPDDLAANELIAALEARVRGLEARVAELERQLERLTEAAEPATGEARVSDDESDEP
jgi:S1-C subfamily serine protease